MVLAWGESMNITVKEIEEMDQYVQEMCHECQDVQETCLGIQEMYN